MPGSAATTEWALAHLPRATESTLQVGLVALVGRAVKTSPDAEVALRALLERRPPKEVRREIYKHLQ